METDREAVRRLVGKLDTIAADLAAEAKRCRNIPDPDAYKGPAATVFERGIDARAGELQRNAAELRGLADLIRQRHLTT